MKMSLDDILQEQDHRLGVFLGDSLSTRGGMSTGIHKAVTREGEYEVIAAKISRLTNRKQPLFVDVFPRGELIPIKLGYTPLCGPVQAGQPSAVLSMRTGVDIEIPHTYILHYNRPDHWLELMLQCAIVEREVLRRFEDIEVGIPSEERQVIGYRGQQFFVADGHLYSLLKMERSEWPTLGSMMNKGMTQDQIISVTRGLIEAVNLLEENKVVHRDLKPENILVDPETYRVKLIDFGITKASEGHSESPSDVGWLLSKETLGSGQLMGTPYYLSPELFTRLSMEANKSPYEKPAITSRADDFSIGRIVCEMIGIDEFPGVELGQNGRVQHFSYTEREQELTLYLLRGRGVSDEVCYAILLSLDPNPQIRNRHTLYDSITNLELTTIHDPTQQRLGLASTAVDIRDDTPTEPQPRYSPRRTVRESLQL